MKGDRADGQSEALTFLTTESRWKNQRRIHNLYKMKFVGIYSEGILEQGNAHYNCANTSNDVVKKMFK